MTALVAMNMKINSKQLNIRHLLVGLRPYLSSDPMFFLPYLSDSRTDDESFIDILFPLLPCLPSDVCI